jgi:hypothetical protein
MRGGIQPSSEVETHPRGHPALERGGVSLVRCVPLERSRVSPEGGWGCQVCGPLPLGRGRFGCVL